MKTIKKVFLGSKPLDFVLLDLNDQDELDSYYQLFIECFGERKNISIDTFKWFNLQTPNYNNLCFAFIDSEESQLICSYGLLPIDVTVNGTIYKSALCTNVMTHPDYAGVGLFHMIGTESLDFAKQIGISFAFGVPNEQAIRGHLKTGWEVVNELRFYQNTPQKTTNIVISERIRVNNFGDIFDGSLLGLFSSKYQFFFNRTNKWMKWRLSKPFSDYLTFTINDPEDFAFVVVKTYFDDKNNTKKLHIVDFGYEKATTFIELVRHCQHYAIHNGFDLINLWQYPFNTDEINVLLGLGFIESTNKNPIIIHKLGNSFDLPNNKWHITLFDNDVY